jgi:Tfp pilus assembly protein PilO
MTRSEAILKIEAQISELEAQLAELEARLPAHSVHPSMIAEIDRLDEKIRAEKIRLNALVNGESGSG